MPNNHGSPPNFPSALAKLRWTEPDAAQIVAAWHASRLSCRAFAEAHAIDPQRLSRWAKRLATPTFAEVFIVDAAALCVAATIASAGESLQP